MKLNQTIRRGISALSLLVALTGVAKADQTPLFPQIKIVSTDPRGIGEVRIEATFVANGDAPHFAQQLFVTDNFRGVHTLNFSGWGGTWDGSFWVGKFFTSVGSSSGIPGQPGQILINQTDTRTLTDLCISVYFKPVGINTWHYDYECIAESPWSVSSATQLQLNGRNGRLNNGTWIGDFLKPYSP